MRLIMKHCCHCHLQEQLHKFKAGKLGLLGGVLIVGHLLFHVAECLILPAILVAFNHPEVEAIAETPSDLVTANLTILPSCAYENLTIDFFESLESDVSLRLSN